MFRVQLMDAVAIVRLEHGKVNAMDLEFLVALCGELERLANDSSVAGVVLANNGIAFSAGVDLKRLAKETGEYIEHFLPAIRRLFREAFEFPKPLIGAIAGHALAGGCVLASSCDYRVLADKAKIGMPELRVGLPLPPEGIEIMRFVAAAQHLQRIVTSGRTFIGNEAVEAGLADEVASPDAVLVRALEMARELIAVPPAVFNLSKRQIRKPIIERICRHESRFMEEIHQLWLDESIQNAVRKYVLERL